MADPTAKEQVSWCPGCNTGTPEGVKPHPCPYKAEINDDEETLCTCCESCTRDCADEI